MVKQCAGKFHFHEFEARSRRDCFGFLFCFFVCLFLFFFFQNLTMFHFSEMKPRVSKMRLS